MSGFHVHVDKKSVAIEHVSSHGDEKHGDITFTTKASGYLILHVEFNKHHKKHLGSVILSPLNSATALRLLYCDPIRSKEKFTIHSSTPLIIGTKYHLNFACMQVEDESSHHDSPHRERCGDR